MLTIQLSNGKTAELSVRKGLYLHTPNHTYVFKEPSKKDKEQNENIKCVVINIATDERQAVETYTSFSERYPFQELIQTLSCLEEDSVSAILDKVDDQILHRINRW